MPSKIDRRHSIPMCHWVLIVMQEHAGPVKVPRSQRSTVQQAHRHLATNLLHETQHRIVRCTCKKNTARVELKQDAPKRPHIDCTTELGAEHDLGRTIEP